MFVVCMREREQLTYKQERKKSNQGKHNYFTDSFFFSSIFSVKLVEAPRFNKLTV